MMALLLVSALTSWFIGFAFLRLVWPRSVPLLPYRFMLAALALGLGAALSATALFLWLVAFGPNRRGFIGAELALAAGLGVLALRSRKRELREPHIGAIKSGLLWFVPAALAMGIGSAVAAFVANSVAMPHGGWDAWMDWNLRARLIFRADVHWRDGFSDLIAWSHPDYPLLVQASVVRAWTWAGGEHLSASAMIACLFTFGTAALTSTALAVLRSPAQGALGALMLLSTPFFVLHGASQYADVPVGFFFLSSVALLAVHQRYAERTHRFAALAGLSAGMAAWTKNEGLLFFTCLLAAQIAMAAIARTQRKLLARQLLAFVAGAFLPLLLVGYFKVQFAPPNDLLSEDPDDIRAWLTDPSRYAIVLRPFISHLLHFGDNGLVSAVWLLVTYSLCAGLRAADRQWSWGFTILLALVLMLAGHVFVFVGTTPDITPLLNTSLDRVLLQLWPSFLVLYFMTVRTPEEFLAGPLPNAPHSQGLGEEVDVWKGS
jgi:hypothetical protein